MDTPVSTAPALPTGTVPASPSPSHDASKSVMVEAPFNDAFSHMDGFATAEKMESGPVPPSPGAKAAKDKSEKPSADAEKPLDESGKPDEQLDQKPDEKPTEDPLKKKESVDPKKEIPVEKMAPKQLRELYANTKNQLKQAEEKLADLTKKLADPSSKLGEEEKKNYETSLAEAKKKIEELEGEVKFTSFEKSADYKEKYEKPYTQAWSKGRQVIAQFKVKGEDGNPRQATQQDFDMLMKLRINDPEAAAEKLDEMFGPKASTVAPYLQRVDEALDNIALAREEWKTNGAAREKAREDESKAGFEKIKSEVGGIWKESVETPAKKYPHWSQPIDGDDKGNELLKNGYEFASKAFQVLDVTGKDITPEQRSEIVKRHAAVFNKAAWFDRVAYLEAQHRKTIKSLEAKLAEFEKSVPGSGAGRGSGSAAPAGESWEAALEKASTKRG